MLDPATNKLQQDTAQTGLNTVFKSCLHKNQSFVVKKIVKTQKLRIYFFNEANVVEFMITKSYTNTALVKFLGFIGRKTIAVIGPDGSGKTTLIDGIKASGIGGAFKFKRFKRYFRRVLFYMRRNTERNQLDQQLIWLILPLSWVTFVITNLLPGYSKPTLLDRYFYDYMVRNVRSKDHELSKVRFYDWWTRHIPRPKKLIVAYCQPEIIHQRKQEMTADAIYRLYQVYLDQIVNGQLDSVLFCHTGLEPQVSCQQAIDFLNDSY